MSRPILLGALVAALSPVLEAQDPDPGLRLYGRLGETTNYLIDTMGNHVHTWQSMFRPGVANYIEPDGTLIRCVFTGSTQLGVGGDGGGVERRALDNSLLWEWRYDTNGNLSHHDICVLPNGNVLMIAWEEVSQQDMIDAGRDPALMQPGVFRPDHIIEVEQTGPTTGNIVWEWHVMDHLIQDFDPTKANFGVVGDHPELVDVNYPPVAPNAGDWNHMNSIDYDPIHDWIILSPRGQNEIWVIDHSTTTAEAAGHTGGNWGKGGDLLYRWGNPEAYRHGSPADQTLFGQHSARIIPQGYRGAGNVVIFNNNVTATSSAVWEIVLPVDAGGRFVRSPSGTYGPAGPIWSFEAPGFHSRFVSSCERLPNGNTLVCSGAQSWLFEVTPGGQIAWQHVAGGTPIFHANYVGRSMWASDDEISLSNGGVVDFDFIGGTSRAYHAYIMLGSVTGTTPGVHVDRALIPLNFDGWFLQTVTSPNVFPLANSAGFLDFRGKATASFGLPPGVFPPVLEGIQFDHAFVTFEPTTGLVEFASNPERFALTQ